MLNLLLISFPTINWNFPSLQTPIITLSTLQPKVKVVSITPTNLVISPIP